MQAHQNWNDALLQELDHVLLDKAELRIRTEWHAGQGAPKVDGGTFRNGIYATDGHLLACLILSTSQMHTMPCFSRTLFLSGDYDVRKDCTLSAFGSEAHINSERRILQDLLRRSSCHSDLDRCIPLSISLQLSQQFLCTEGAAS